MLMSQTYTEVLRSCKTGNQTSLNLKRIISHVHDDSYSSGSLVVTCTFSGSNLLAFVPIE